MLAALAGRIYDHAPQQNAFPLASATHTVPRRRLATAISPAAAVLTFAALLRLHAWITQPDPGPSIQYPVAYLVVLGLPITYGIVAVVLYPPFRVMLADQTLTPRTVYSAATLTGALGAMSLWVFDPPVDWPSVGILTLFGGIAGLIGGLVFVQLGGPRAFTRRAR